MLGVPLGLQMVGAGSSQSPYCCFNTKETKTCKPTTPARKGGEEEEEVRGESSGGRKEKERMERRRDE